MPSGVYVRSFIKPELTQIELGWLAGILEGEGSFYFSVDSYINAHVHISVHSTDQDIILRIGKLMHTKCRGAAPPRQPHHKKQYFTFASGEQALFIMRMLLPYMGERRTVQIRSAIIGWENRDAIKEWMRSNRKIPLSHLSLESLGL